MRQSYKVRKNIFYGEDLLVNADYFSKSDSAVVIDEKLYFYRKDNPDSAMAQARSVKKLSLIPMWREMADIYSAIGLEEEAQRIMANYYDSLLAGYLGGVLQILFGIKGRRWDESDTHLMYNENWVYPDRSEIPAGADKVENACYWEVKTEGKEGSDNG